MFCTSLPMSGGKGAFRSGLYYDILSSNVVSYIPSNGRKFDVCELERIWKIPVIA